MWARLCLFFFILQHSVLFVLVVLYVLSYPAAPSPPLSPLLPSPNIFGLQLVCFALLPEFRLQSQNRPWLLVFPVMRRKERGGESKELKPPGHQRMIRTDPFQAQSECRLNVLLLYLQQPPSCSPPTPHTLYAHMHVSSQADTFTLGRLQASFFHFFVCRLSPALSSVSLLVQCCRFVCQPAIKACLCLHLPFLPSLTSPLFFISSLPLAPL